MATPAPRRGGEEVWLEPTGDDQCADHPTEKSGDQGDDEGGHGHPVPRRQVESLEADTSVFVRRYRRALMLWQPAGDEVENALADIDGVVADALVEAGDHGQLHRYLGSVFPAAH